MINIISTSMKYMKEIQNFLIRKRKTFFYAPYLIEKPIGKRIIVLSPHLDDEVIGCGGTILKHIIGGDDVILIYLTDATNSLPDTFSYKEKIIIRKKESHNAQKVLGIKEAYYLNEPDGDIRIKRETIKNLQKIILNYKPELIYLPWYFDNHVDHRKFNEILFRVWKKTKINVKICAYEVWTPLIPNIIVDISDQHEKKIQALKCYKTQVSQNNYIDKVNGLNIYRSMTHFNEAKYIEAFYYTPINKYFKLFK